MLAGPLADVVGGDARALGGGCGENVASELPLRPQMTQLDRTLDTAQREPHMSTLLESLPTHARTRRVPPVSQRKLDYARRKLD